MHRDLAEINVQKLSVHLSYDLQQRAKLAVRNLPRHVAHLSEPEAPQEMRSRLGDNVDRLKWVALSLFALLRDHHRTATFQTSYLPIDVQHLRFQERRAIAGDNRQRVACRVERSRDISHCSQF